MTRTLYALLLVFIAGSAGAQTIPDSWTLHSNALSAPCVNFHDDTGAPYLRICSDPPSLWMRDNIDANEAARRFLDALRNLGFVFKKDGP